MNNNHIRIRIWDWLLIIGIVLTPMNELRVWKIGPAEVLCLLWCLKSVFYISRLRLSDFFLRFWSVFLVIILAGSVFGTLFYPEESSITGVLTYFFFAFVSLGVYTGIQRREAPYVEEMLHLLCAIASCWYMFLLIYSRLVSRTFFGIPLWYSGRRFSGGTNNPHQLAVLLSTLIFCNLRYIFSRKQHRKWFFVHLVSLAFCVIIAEETESSTLVMSVAITFAAVIYWRITTRLQNTQQKIGFTLFFILILYVFTLVFAKRMYSLVYSWIASDDNGLGRFYIFKSIIIVLRKNWLIGLGPGIHGLNGTIELHNMYLEVLAMGGILGLITFIVFSIRLFSHLKIDPMFVFSAIPLYLYGLAGFTIRRLAFWTMVPLLVGLATIYNYEDRGLKCLKE